MTTHQLQFNSSTSPSTPTGWVDCGSDVTAGVKASNIEGTGVNFELLTSAGTQVISGSITSQEHHGIPEVVWDRYWATPSFGTFDGRFSGFAAGQTGTIEFFGRSGNSGRHRVVTYDGVNYQNDEADPPSAPTSFSFTADASGNVDFTFGYASTNAAYAGLILTIDDNAATLTAPTTVTPTEASSLTITGVASGTTASSLTLDDGDTTVTQTIDSQSHDGTETLTVNFTPVQGNIKFQSGLTLEATLSDASTVSGTTELVTIAGNAAVNVSNPITTENSVYHEATSPNADTPETGDQIEHTDAANTTVAADGTITQTEVRNFEARFWSVTDRTWGSFETISPFDVGDDWPYPIDDPSIPVTWEWGGRHPKTGARVRLFKVER